MPPAATTPPGRPPGPVPGPAPCTVVVGDEELLVQRAVADVVAAARAVDPAVEVRDILTGQLGPGELSSLLAPSLFGEGRVVALRAVHEAAKPVAEELIALLGDPPDGTVLVLTHGGGAKGRALLDAATAAGAQMVRCSKPTRPNERIEFVVSEIRRAGRQISGDGAAALLAAVGTDLRELATACSQLVSDTTGTIEAEVVARYHQGRADATGFAVADRAVEGDPAAALELLRWAVSLGVAPVLVTSALAANLRLIARVAGAGRVGPAALARDLGAPLWRVERAVRWARRWRPGPLAQAIRAVAAADGQVKGAAADPAYAVERVVLTVATVSTG